MHFNTDAVPAEMVALFRRFVAITGWAPWKARLAALRQQIETNPFIKEYFAERFPLEFEMERLHHRIQLGRNIKLPETYEAYTLLSFIAMVARAHRRLSAKGQHRLAGMLRSGLNNESGLAPLQHEFGIAAHLMSKGFDVTFSDIESGSGFDLLAEREGVELEVECKTHSADIGRKVHRRRLYQLGGRIIPMLESALEDRNGGQLARVILPKRLDGNDQHLRSISRCIAAALQNGTSIAGPEPCSIDYKTFSVSGSPFETVHPTTLDRETARKFIEGEVGYPISHALMWFRPYSRVIALTIESAQPDRVVDGMIRQLKALVKRQLTGTRPSLICIKLLDVTEYELLELTKPDEDDQLSSLQIISNMLLHREDWRQVHTLAYMTPGHLVASSFEDAPMHTRTIRETTRPYVFVNPYNELASDCRLKIF